VDLQDFGNAGQGIGGILAVVAIGIAFWEIRLQRKELQQTRAVHDAARRDERLFQTVRAYAAFLAEARTALADYQRVLTMFRDGGWKAKDRERHRFVQEAIEALRRSATGIQLYELSEDATASVTGLFEGIKHPMGEPTANFEERRQRQLELVGEKERLLNDITEDIRRHVQAERAAIDCLIDE
jgi:uncharacterized membrane protein